MFDNQSFSGKVALVTGASRGIGKEIAMQLSKSGAKVAINYAKSAQQAEAVVDEIKAAGGEAIALQFDVSNEQQVEKGVAEIIEKFSKIDILVNNAGIASDGLLMRTKSEDWQRTIDVNLTSCFLLCKAVSRPMMKARTGRIINISSVIGEMGNAGQVAYAASKAGVFGLTKTLAKELGSRSITVNAVTPGFIETDMTSYLTPEKVEVMLSQIPAGRLGNVQDVSNLVCFLASDKSSYITGQILGVNGGMYM
jgi:3-oxoacyl-[acyl-carrier protein] reductase